VAEAERHRRRGQAAGSVAAPPSEQETVRTLTCSRSCAVQLGRALEPWSARKSVCGCTSRPLHGVAHVVHACSWET